jgi:hypothetical protein
VISEKIGSTLKKNTKKIWWIKLGIALIVSNIFFFILFKGNSEFQTDGHVIIPTGWVEVQLNAELMTPFHSGKKVLIIHRTGRKKLEGVLQNPSSSEPGKITILVREAEAHTLFLHESWEVLPYLRNLNFVSARKKESHEIRY